MVSKLFFILSFLLSSTVYVHSHARIKHPRPLAAAPENPSGNYYNDPLRADGSQFPCKGLNTRADVIRTPSEVWKAGELARFEILHHNTADGLGNLAAHSGGSCQASLSFDNGETWKVLHSYQGGCPRDVPFESNMAGLNQVFFFRVPQETKAGPALFSWTWIAVTGNRNEFYQNCASVMISGSGNSTLNHLPDMFVGDMTISGHIGPGECRSVANSALIYPNPGLALTITEVENVTFQEPTPGKCYSKATVVNQTVTTSTTIATTTTVPVTTITTTTTAPVTTITTTKPTTVSTTSITTSSILTTSTPGECRSTFPSTFQIVVDNKPRSCNCVCEN